MNWFEQLLRESAEKQQLMDDLEAFVCVVVIFVLLFGVLWL
jgi:hypothetical protein